MKNIIKYLGVSILAFSLVTSCDDTNVGSDEELNYNTGINVVQFPSAAVTAPAVADGEVKSYNVKILAAGPDIANISGNPTVNFSVDPASTAVAGVHYTLDSNSITLSQANDYLGNIPISIITEGIDPPSSETLILNLDSVSGSGDNVVISGNKGKVVITISYSCFADLAGTYTVTNDFCNVGAGRTTTIEGNSDGSWSLGTGDGYWIDVCTGNAGFFNPGSIFVICGVVEVATLNENCASQNIACVQGGTWDDATGTLNLELLDVFFNGGPYNWTATYVRQ